MASEYWLCVQIPALPGPVQTEKDGRRSQSGIFAVTIELSEHPWHQPP
ncbi:hypothetical protein QFZ85_004862 [Pseudomonas frederiksbergensis]